MKPIIFFAVLLISINCIFAQSVQVDETWANQGFVILEITGENLVISDYYYSDAGEIFAVGYTQLPTSSFKKSFLIKIAADGSLDTNFGDNGMFRPELYYDEDHQFHDVVERDDGTLLVTGSMQSGQGPAISAFFMSLNADGSLDTTYGDEGFSEEYGGTASGTGYRDIYKGNTGDLFFSKTFFHQSYNYPELYFSRSGDNSWSYWLGDGLDAWYSASRAYVSPEDEFYLPMAYNGSSSGQGVAAILKFDSDGLDANFGSDGVYEYDETVPGDLYAHAAGLGDGSIAVVGRTEIDGLNKILLTKLSDSGAPDVTFGDNGHLIFGDDSYDYQASDVFFAESESLIIAKISRANDEGVNNGLLVVNEDGTIAESFGENGIAWADDLLPGSMFRPLLLEDGSLLFAGRSTNGDGIQSSYFGKFLFDFEYQGFQSTSTALSSGETRYYQQGSKTISLEIDSVGFDGDSIFYPHPHWYETGSECYLPYNSSYLGKEIRISPNGTHRFITGENDTVTLHFQNSLDETWIAYESPDGEQVVEATVAGINEEAFLGELLPVKTISLQMLNADLEPVDHSINNAYFKFTDADAGLLVFPSLADFPNSDPNSFGFGFSGLKELVGIEGQAGTQGLQTFDIFNFEIGDEIHFEQGDQYAGDLNLWQVKETVLDKSVYPDSLVYELEIKRWNYSGPASEIDVQLYDTQIITRTIVPDSLFDLPAGQPLIQGNYGYFSWLENSDFGPAKNYYYGDPLFEESFEGDSCYTSAIDWGCFSNLETHERYYKGLGGPYYHCNESLISSNWRQLLFYSANGTQWGEPLNTNEQASRYQTLNIYPNPATNIISLERGEFAQNGEVRILNSVGKRVIAQPFHTGDIDVSNLASGLYIVLVTQDNNVVTRGRFVKEND